jgi:glycine dehydrogenase subunit 1
MATVGKHGLREIAEACFHKAHHAAALIDALPGYSVDMAQPFFNEFVVRCPVAPVDVTRELLKRHIIGGLDVSDDVENGMLLCVTEVNTSEEIDRLRDALAEVGR